MNLNKLVTYIYKKIQYLLVLFISLIIIVSCNGDEKEETVYSLLSDSQISIYPEEVEAFGIDTIPFVIKLDYPGNYKWKIIDKPSWLMFSKEQGIIRKDSIEFEAMLDPSVMQTGRAYCDSFSIVTEGAGSCQAVILMKHEKYLCPEFSPKKIFFPSGINSQFITFYNPEQIRNVMLSFRSDDKWLSTDVPYLSITKGESKKCKLSIDRTNLPAGEINGRLTLNYGHIGWRDSLFLPVRVDNPKTNIATTDKDTVLFLNHENTHSFYLKNTGNTEFSFSLDNNSPGVSFSPSTGTINIGDSTKINIHLNRNRIPEGINKLTIPILNSNAQETNNIVLIFSSFVGKYINLDCEIRQAIYNNHNDELILVTAHPHEIRIYNISDLSYQKMDLNLRPNTVAISPNGKKLAIGSFNEIAYYDLHPLRHIVAKTVEGDCFNIALTDEDWAFVSPQDGVIFGYNFISDIKAEFLNHTTSASSKLQLVSSGKHLLCGYQRSEFAKFDVSGGFPKFLYTSKSYFISGVGNRYWFVESDDRIILANGDVHKLTDDKNTDLKKVGTLGIPKDVMSLDFSANTNQFCIAFKNFEYDQNTFANQISILDASSYTLTNQFTMPKSGFYHANIQSCFFNSSGSKIIVVLENKTYNINNNKHAIYIRDL